MADDWNYMAARITGDGTFDILETELPLEISSIDRELSAPGGLQGTITNEVLALKKAGRPIFEPWNTVLLAQAGDQLRAAGIYRLPTFEDRAWKLDTVGISGYPIGMSYSDSVYFIDADPLDIFRHIWAHLQSQPNGNLGVTIDPLQSPIRVGTQVENVQFQTGEGQMVAFEAGPRKLNWYQTDDLGKEVDSYAKETPFDWVEQVYWDGDAPHCHIALGYPQIGTRRTDVTGFVLGENFSSTPAMAEADYVNQVIVRGAGEGRDAVRGFAALADGRLRRIKTVENKSKKSISAANTLAADTLASLRGDLTVDTLEVFDHPNAPLEGIGLGDEFQVYAETDYNVFDGWVRVVGRSDTPGRSDTATLTVVRSVMV